MKDKVWVCVANGSIARIFALNDSHQLHEIKTLEHEATRLHGRDLISAKPGRSYDSVGGGRHAVGPELTPQRNEAEHFAQEVGAHLEHARAVGELKRLYLVASPAFLGELRKCLRATTKGCIAGEIDRDATSKKPEEIREYLPKIL